MAHDLIDTSDVRKELEALKDDLSQVRKSVKDMMATVVEQGKRQSADMSDSVRSELDRRMNEMGDRYDRLRDKSAQTIYQAKRQATEHPFATLLGTIALGSVAAIVAEWVWLRKR